MSRIAYRSKFQGRTLRSLITHISGGLGTILYLICLIPLIYLVNRKPEIIIIMNSKILPMAILRAIQMVLFTLCFTVLPLQISYLPNGEYVSDGVCFINDLKSIKERKEQKNINMNS